MKHFLRRSRLACKRLIPIVAGIALAVICSTRAEASLAPEISAGSTGLGISVNRALPGHRALRLEYDAIDFGGYKLVTRTNDVLTPTGGGVPVGAQLVFDDTFHPQSISLLLDQHFGPSPVYVSIGIVDDLNRLDAVSRPNESNFLLNGTNYTGTAFGTLYVHVRWSALAPYLGVGFQKQPAPGSTKRSARFEIGAFAQGTRRISVDTSGVVAANPGIFGPYVTAFQNAVPSHIPALSIYPVARFSIPVGH